MQTKWIKIGGSDLKVGFFFHGKEDVESHLTPEHPGSVDTDSFGWKKYIDTDTFEWKEYIDTDNLKLMAGSLLHFIDLQ